jgi:hypothetical protein
VVDVEDREIEEVTSLEKAERDILKHRHGGGEASPVGGGGRSTAGVGSNTRHRASVEQRRVEEAVAATRQAIDDSC